MAEKKYDRTPPGKKEDLLHRKVWNLKRKGYTSGQVAEELKIKNLARVNVLYVRPLPMDPAERAAIRHGELAYRQEHSIDTEVYW